MSYGKYIYARKVNPGTKDEYEISGSSPEDVADTVVGESESLSPDVARYRLVGIGRVHTSATVYVEHAAA